MNCPYCHLEMITGSIPTQSLEWIPKDGKLKITYTSDKSKGFRIGKHHFGNTKNQTASYCPHCDKIIIDCTDE